MIQVNVLGAGLVGILASVYFRKSKHNVTVFEKRRDPRLHYRKEGRSINLALSIRGIEALKKVGLYDQVVPIMIPMKGRMIHDSNGETNFQPYGIRGECIHSISRIEFTKLLINEAEKFGIQFKFDHKCQAFDLATNGLKFLNDAEATGELTVGADGAYSIVRRTYARQDRYNVSHFYIDYGYKELEIPPLNKEYAIKPNYLHIWPRGQFMLIALPNTNKSFTCTLFLPFEGVNSFESLQNPQDIQSFFEKYFSDALKVMPNLLEEFANHPTSSMVTVNCKPWTLGSSILLGDAAHAMVPFFGQGMNAGFEDVSILFDLAESKNYAWKEILPVYTSLRKKDADAISDLAMENFIEMRDSVNTKEFQNKLKIEHQVQSKYPNIWTSRYSMISFSTIPYSQAKKLGDIQQMLINQYYKSDKSLHKMVEEYKKIIEFN